MEKLDRLDAYLEERDLESVWFARPSSFAWLTGGDNVVSRKADVGVAAAGYDGRGLTVVTDNIEAPRLGDEELDEGVTIETFEWYERSLAEAVSNRASQPAAADFDVPGFEDVEAGALRQPLTDAEIERYRDLSREVAAVVERVCRGLASTDTEQSAAARLRGALAEKNIDAPVALVGGGERAPQYRHYTPKDEELGEYALLSVTAVRDGLHTSTTRTIAFDPPSWLRDRTRVAMRVEATALAATREVGREGGVAADVFEAIQEAYASQGWEGEWRNHHQGGAAGYAGREWFGTPTSDAPVRLPMAYAWNPTVQGAKSEDTFLVTGEIENLTRTGEWPTREVEAVGYDLALERHEVLDVSR